MAPAATTYTGTGGLDGVAAVSGSDAWAVGNLTQNDSQQILMLHWNGKAWSRVTQPSVLTSAGGLSAIKAVNAKDVWAVGSTGSASGTTHTLLLHWNGSAWSQVTTPGSVKDGVLTAVTATTSGGWAVGYVSASAEVNYQTLVFRLSGSKWSRASTKLGNGVALTGVATTSKGTAWAIGNATGMIYGTVAHWNGKTWNWLKSFPVQGLYHGLYGIAAGPGGIGFAVGYNGNVPETPAISMKWTGKAWVKATVDAPEGSGLNAVTFAPGGTAWAAGEAGSHPMILKWNGKEWTRVTGPSSGWIDGLGFSAASYGWAVGSAISSSATQETLILHWNGHAWS